MQKEAPPIGSVFISLSLFVALFYIWEFRLLRRACYVCIHYSVYGMSNGCRRDAWVQQVDVWTRLNLSVYIDVICFVVAFVLEWLKMFGVSHLNVVILDPEYIVQFIKFYLVSLRILSVFITHWLHWTYTFFYSFSFEFIFAVESTWKSPREKKANNHRSIWYPYTNDEWFYFSGVCPTSDSALQSPRTI